MSTGGPLYCQIVGLWNRSPVPLKRWPRSSGFWIPTYRGKGTMEFIVYGALACALLLLRLSRVRQAWPGNLDHVALIGDAYQALIDHGQQAKNLVVSDDVDDSTVTSALDRFQKAINRLALEQDAADVYQLAESFYMVLLRAARARKQTPRMLFSDDMLEAPYRDVQEAARDSLSKIRRGEVVSLHK